MKFEIIKEFVKGVPFISEINARWLYDLIIRERFTSILELGIAHGTATSYIAAALDELGFGKVTSVDLLETKTLYQPSPEEQLNKSGLQRLVQIVRTQTGYTWFLHDEIKRLTKNDVCMQAYDLCIIDGPKNWTIDGCAFFLVDKLLKENGIIIFDDYSWSYAQAGKKRDMTDGITHRKLSESERNTPQVKEIFELLVKQHPNYSEFVVLANSDWAMARKIRSDNKKCSIVYRENFESLLSIITYKARKLFRS